MAGFMAGFGSAFSDSFNATRKREADDKSDLFKMQYTDYISKRDERTKQDAINAKNVKAAKEMVRMTGQPDDAWGAVYSQLSADIPAATIMKQLEENQATVEPVTNVTSPGDNGAPADPRDDLTQGASSAVDSQMKSSGMATPPGGGIFSRIGAALGGNTQEAPETQDRSSRFDQGLDRVAEASGTTTDDVKNTLNSPAEGTPVPGADDFKVTWAPKASAGTAPDLGKVTSEEEAQTAIDWYTSKGMTKEAEIARTMLNNQMKITDSKLRLKAIAEGTMPEINTGAIRGPDNTVTNVRKSVINGEEIWTDGLGNQVDAAKVEEDTPAMLRDIDEMTKAQAQPTQDYYVAADTFKQTARTGTALVQILKKYPQAEGMTNNLSQVFDFYKRGAQNILSILNPTTDEDGNLLISGASMSKAESIEKDLEKKLAGPLDANTRVAIASALVDIKTTKLAYAAAAQQGQTGKGVNQQEFENFRKSFSSGGPKAIMLSVNETLQDMQERLKDQANNINKNSIYMRKFEQIYGRPSPFQPVEDPDKLMESDPELRQNFERLRGDADSTGFTQTKQPVSEPMPEGLPDGITQEDWDIATPEEKKLFLGDK